MPQQFKLDQTYLYMCNAWGSMSHSTRAKVGCLIVKNGQIISDGYNGTPTGFDNVCEDENGNSKPEVMHAEFNALMKLACSTNSSIGATLYTTMSPRYECAKAIVPPRIIRVVYNIKYRLTAGLDLLKQANIETTLMHW